MDEPVKAHYSCFRELDDTTRLNLMGEIWTTDQQITQLLEQHGYPPDGSRMFIELGIVTILTGIHGVFAGPLTEEALELEVTFGIVQHPELIHSASSPLPVVDFYTLDKIVNGLDWPKLVRLVRSGLPRDIRLDKTTIWLIQKFISEVIAGLLNEARV